MHAEIQVLFIFCSIFGWNMLPLMAPCSGKANSLYSIIALITTFPAWDKTVRFGDQRTWIWRWDQERKREAISWGKQSRYSGPLHVAQQHAIYSGADAQCSIGVVCIYCVYFMHKFVAMNDADDWDLIKNALKFTEFSLYAWWIRKFKAWQSACMRFIHRASLMHILHAHIQ